MTTLITLIVFIVALFSVCILFFLKYWEMEHEYVFFHSFRKRADVWVEKGMLFLHTKVPDTSKKVSRDVTTHVAFHTSDALLKGVRATEKQLTRFSNMVKGQREIRNGRTASTYLQDVSAHKKELNSKNF